MSCSRSAQLAEFAHTRSSCCRITFTGSLLAVQELEDQTENHLSSKGDVSGGRQPQVRDLFFGETRTGLQYPLFCA